MDKKARRHKVVVAMSGGIDSSACAAILKDKGFDLFGVTMQLKDAAAGGEPYDLGRAEQAKRVADSLGIAHYIFDLREPFAQKVISYFCEEYQQGRTPNPCVRCNKYIKFDLLFEKAREFGADYIATGHYASIDIDEQSQRYILRKGKDTQKEQSYFLYALSQEQLSHTLLPLAGLTKEEVRGIAQEKGLPVSAQESQEICFIPDNRYGDFLRTYMPAGARPGDIVNQEGEVIGRHQGIVFYTIGQRKGISIPDKEALYVTAIDKEANTVTVGKKSDAYSESLVVDELNLISMDKLDKPLRAEVKVRYMHQQAAATIVPRSETQAEVAFDQPQWAVTPGQSAVFYDRDIVLGGGVIQRVDFS